MTVMIDVCEIKITGTIADFKELDLIDEKEFIRLNQQNKDKAIKSMILENNEDVDKIIGALDWFNRKSEIEVVNIKSKFGRPYRPFGKKIEYSREVFEIPIEKFLFLRAKGRFGKWV